MKPSQLSTELRKIAHLIDTTDKPKRMQVANDLNKLIYKISSSSTEQILLNLLTEGGTKELGGETFRYHVFSGTPKLTLITKEKPMPSGDHYVELFADVSEDEYQNYFDSEYDSRGDDGMLVDSGYVNLSNPHSVKDFVKMIRMTGAVLP